MGEEPDINKIVVEFVNQNLDRFYGTGKDILKGTADKVRLYLFTTYRDYLSCITARYSKAKTFLIRSEAISLYNFYVPTGISCGETRYTNPSISEIARRNPFIVVTGGGPSVNAQHSQLSFSTPFRMFSRMKMRESRKRSGAMPRLMPILIRLFPSRN